MFYGQLLQDAWVAEQLQDFDLRRGYYVDVGCHDGHELSNTLYFAERGMPGLCIDANRRTLELAKKTRHAEFECCAVSHKNGEVGFKVSHINDMLSGIESVYPDYKIECKTLATILDEHHAPKEITYLSIDTEGHEYEALLGLGDYDPQIITIEHNGKSEKASKILDWLWSRNYLVRNVAWDFFAIKDRVRLEK